MVHTLCIGVKATLGGPRDGREITHPTDPDVIVLGYEGIIGAQERPSPHGATFAAEYSR
jgi:hypothetical protein